MNKIRSPDPKPVPETTVPGATVPEATVPEIQQHENTLSADKQSIGVSETNVRVTESPDQLKKQGNQSYKYILNFVTKIYLNLNCEIIVIASKRDQSEGNNCVLTTCNFQ